MQESPEVGCGRERTPEQPLQRPDIADIHNQSAHDSQVTGLGQERVFGTSGLMTDSAAERAMSR